MKNQSEFAFDTFIFNKQHNKNKLTFTLISVFLINIIKTTNIRHIKFKKVAYQMKSQC